MKILFFTDIFKHPFDHIPTNHDWLAKLWFPTNKIDVITIKNLLDEQQSILKYLPDTPYFTDLEPENTLRITAFLKSIINDFDYVIAFECTKDSREILNKIHDNIIYSYFSPLRYADRQTFTLSSNNVVIQKKIDEVFSSARYYYLSQANYVKTLIDNKLENLDIPNNSLLLVGQVEEDLSVWDGDKYTSLDSYINEITEKLTGFTNVYYKAHPYSKNNNVKILSELDVNITNENMYRLLSSDSICHVVAVSSSVIEEARFFGKKTTQFLHCYIPKESKSIPYSLDSSFWDYLMDKEIKKVSLRSFEIDRVDIRPIRNTYWGYKFIKKLEFPLFEEIDAKLSDQNRVLKEDLINNNSFQNNALRNDIIAKVSDQNRVLKEDMNAKLSDQNNILMAEIRQIKQKSWSYKFRRLFKSIKSSITGNKY